jgi:hypothetical protein
MKRVFGLGLFLALSVFAVALHNPVQTHAEGAIAVSPASGSQDDAFAFAGMGFDPSDILAVVYQDPNGVQFTYTLPDGSPDVITPDADGSFVLIVHPRTDFAGAAPGTWTVAFCTGSGSCFSGTIDISL